MKNWVIAGLIAALGYTSIQLTRSRLDLQKFQQGSRSYMLIQQAYNEGLADGCKEVEDDVLVD